MQLEVIISNICTIHASKADVQAMLRTTVALGCTRVFVQHVGVAHVTVYNLQPFEDVVQEQRLTSCLSVGVARDTVYSLQPFEDVVQEQRLPSYLSVGVARDTVYSLQPFEDVVQEQSLTSSTAVLGCCQGTTLNLSKNKTCVTLTCSVCLHEWLVSLSTVYSRSRMLSRTTLNLSKNKTCVTLTCSSTAVLGCCPGTTFNLSKNKTCVTVTCSVCLHEWLVSLSTVYSRSRMLSRTKLNLSKDKTYVTFNCSVCLYEWLVSLSTVYSRSRMLSRNNDYPQ
ncbi:hypothetical protein J6590_036187 [Homalodisca vitripennis]|nr:hypothetical protein J6590_036187 [Homalodisca vitripennis]